MPKDWPKKEGGTLLIFIQRSEIYQVLKEERMVKVCWKWMNVKLRYDSLSFVSEWELCWLISIIFVTKKTGSWGQYVRSGHQMSVFSWSFEGDRCHQVDWLWIAAMLVVLSFDVEAWWCSSKLPDGYCIHMYPLCHVHVLFIPLFVLGPRMHSFVRAFLPSIHACIHAIVHLLFLSFCHSCLHALIDWLIDWLIDRSIDRLIDGWIDWLIDWFVRSFICSFILSFIHSLTHSFMHHIESIEWIISILILHWPYMKNIFHFNIFPDLESKRFLAYTWMPAHMWVPYV